MEESIALASMICKYDKLRDGVHDLRRSIMLSRVTAAMEESLEERMRTAGAVLDRVERILEELEGEDIQ
jgi:hypothetical protein